MHAGVRSTDFRCTSAIDGTGAPGVCHRQHSDGGPQPRTVPWAHGWAESAYHAHTIVRIPFAERLDGYSPKLANVIG